MMLSYTHCIFSLSSASNAQSRHRLNSTGNVNGDVSMHANADVDANMVAEGGVNADSVADGRSLANGSDFAADSDDF